MTLHTLTQYETPTTLNIIAITTQISPALEI